MTMRTVDPGETERHDDASGDEAVRGQVGVQ